MGDVARFECECGYFSEALFLGFGQVDCLYGRPNSRRTAYCVDCVAVFVYPESRWKVPCPACGSNAGLEDDGLTAVCIACDLVIVPKRHPVCPSCDRGARQPVNDNITCPSCHPETFLQVVKVDMAPDVELRAAAAVFEVSIEELEE